MGQINVSLPSDGTTAEVSDYNTPITTIVDEINGALDNSNISASAAIAGSKLASGGVDTTQLANGAVEPDKLATGAATASVATSETTGSTTYTALTTAGPAVTVTTGVNGIALVYIKARMANTTDTAINYMSFAISGATTVAASDTFATQRRVSDNNAAGLETSGALFLVTGLTAGSNTFTASYRVNAGTGTFDTRSILVVPL